MLEGHDRTRAHYQRYMLLHVWSLQSFGQECALHPHGNVSWPFPVGEMAAWPPWFPGTPLPGMAAGTMPAGTMPAPPTLPPMMDPAAAMAMQRQQAESLFQQAWQNLSALNEMSAQAAKQAEDDSVAEVQKKDAVQNAKPGPVETPADERPEPAQPVASDKAAPAPPDEKPQPGPQKPQEGQIVVPAGKVVVRIRKVASFDTGDGTLEVYCRFTPREEGNVQEAAAEDGDRPSQEPEPSNVPGDVPAEGHDTDEQEFVKPKPKKRPAIPRAARVCEPDHPPHLGLIHSFILI